MKYIVFNVEFSRVLGQKVFHRRDLYQKILQFIFFSPKRLQHGIISGLAHDKKKSQIKYGSSETQTWIYGTEERERELRFKRMIV